jgi:hypothetical protein
MRWVAMMSVAAAACSFQGVGDNPGGDGPIGDPIDAPFGTPDARVADAALIDARPADARRPDAMPPLPDAGFTVALCPPAYNLTSPTSPGSRYRVIDVPAPFATQHADCNDDLPSTWTHLVTFQSQAEAQDAADMLLAQYFYVGMVQAPNQASPELGWAWFDGSTTLTAWDTGVAQPDDNGGGENNAQNLGVGDAGDGELQDVAGAASYEAVCECDGVPVDPAVAANIP